MTDEQKAIRLSKAAKEFNIGISTIVEFLNKKSHIVENNPNAKISPEMYDLLAKEFQAEKSVKEESLRIALEHAKTHETITIDVSVRIPEEQPKRVKEEELIIKHSGVFGIDLDISSPKKPKLTPEPPFIEPIAEEKPVLADLKVEIEEKIAEEIQEEIKKESIEHTKEVEISIKKDVSVDEVPSTKQTLTLIGTIDLDAINQKTRPDKKSKADKKKKLEEKPKLQEIVPVTEIQQEQVEIEVIEEVAVPDTQKTEVIEQIDEKPQEVDNNFLKTKYAKLSGPTIVGKMELPKAKIQEKPPVVIAPQEGLAKKRKRKRIKKAAAPVEANKEQKQVENRFEKPKFKEAPKGKKVVTKVAPSEEDIQKQIKETLSKLTSGSKSKASKYRRQKREMVSQHVRDEKEKLEHEKAFIKVTEFVTANELATMMNVPVVQIISTCMSLGLFVSINQRLDAETISIVADEFGFDVEFVSVEVSEAIRIEEDAPEDLVFRNPIVAVMGHVDHGKTSLLDHIRKTNVIAGEAGGITQHIGAYEVTLADGRKITFLDTPGHEAFTAMRARGAKITDVAVVVVAADDNVMPQTKEAINHAKAAGVPIVFAINKIDKSGANPEKIKEELANLNILVEDWGGKFQSQEISAKQGTNVDKLLEKILLEAELLELTANPNRKASGTILESSLDKGRGYVAKLLVQNGSMKVGDMVLAGYCYGRVKAMYNERNQRVEEAGPATPVLMLGLNGAPQAGDGFNILNDEKEVKSIAAKREQLQREQGLRTQKHITLDEIGRRIAIGDFKELNIIVKGDVDGSVEALSDALIKLSNKHIQVNVIHKAVGQVTEGDVLLATASDAIIVAFQVRPSLSARKLAEHEQIDIRMYSIIYQAIDEIKAAMEGMLSPDIEEKIICNIEIREVFNITKVGTVAGCMVLDGKINRNTKIRLIRDGIVIYSGNLSTLKRYKDDVKEVSKGFECGLSIDRYNDLKVGDIVEGYEEIEVKKKM